MVEWPNTLGYPLYLCMCPLIQYMSMYHHLDEDLFDITAQSTKKYMWTYLFRIMCIHVTRW